MFGPPAPATPESPKRSDGPVERVAGARVTAAVAGREPLLALGRRAVRPGVRVDLALRGLLDAVVPDRGGSIERVGDLLVRDRFEVAGARGVVRPDAREAVGLELGADRAALRTLLARLPAEDAEQVLNVVAVFMSEDVALRQRPALRPEARAKLLE